MQHLMSPTIEKKNKKKGWCVFTHYNCRRSSHHAVEDEGRDEAGLFLAGVRLHQLSVITEEALHVDAEQVSALHVVGQQHCAGHDDELGEKHGALRRIERKKEEQEPTAADWLKSLFLKQPCVIPEPPSALLSAETDFWF